MRIKFLVSFVLAGVCAAGPAAAASQFVVMHASRGFSIPHMAHGTLSAVHPHLHPHFAGGALGVVLGDTLGPDYSTGALPPPPPYPPAVYYPAAYAPQRHCVRPEIIYLTDQKPAANPVRIIYGTAPPQCP